MQADSAHANIFVLNSQSNTKCSDNGGEACVRFAIMNACEKCSEGTSANYTFNGLKTKNVYA